jgi:hypothetical protein
MRRAQVLKILDANAKVNMPLDNRLMVPGHLSRPQERLRGQEGTLPCWDAENVRWGFNA